MRSAAAKRTVASRDGTRIAYWQSGHGDPLVLVHGTTSDHTRWTPLLELLEPHATVYAMDRRGRPGSGDADPYAIEREFEDVAAVVDAVANETGIAVDLFGHSFGALCSLEAAMLTPDIRRLALYEAPIGAAELPGLAVLLDDLDQLVASGRDGDAIERFFRDCVGTPEPELELLKDTDAWAIRVANARTMLRELRAAGSYQFDAGRFRSMSVPTVVLVGDDRPAGTQRPGEEVTTALPNATLVILDGQHHMAMDTAPQRFVDRLVDFFGYAARS